MDGAFPWPYTRWESGQSTTVDGQVIDEGLVRIHVNGLELATFMCTPCDLDLLALGFLRAEGIIQGRAGCAPGAGLPQPDLRGRVAARWRCRVAQPADSDLWLWRRRDLRRSQPARAAHSVASGGSSRSRFWTVCSS